VEITKTVNLSKDQKHSIIRLWNAEYPAQIQHSGIDSFDEYLSSKGNLQHYLLTDDNENIKGWLATFMRDGEKWFALLVDGSEQKKGYGTMLLNKVKEFENEINGWAIDREKDVKSNGETYLSPIRFYLKNDFEILNDVRLETETMSAVKIKWINELLDQKSDS
jgi:GNAT superfamily N-acetyltransferase